MRKLVSVSKQIDFKQHLGTNQFRKPRFHCVLQHCACDKLGQIHLFYGSAFPQSLFRSLCSSRMDDADPDRPDCIPARGLGNADVGGRTLFLSRSPHHQRHVLRARTRRPLSVPGESRKVLVVMFPFSFIVRLSLSLNPLPRFLFVSCFFFFHYLVNLFVFFQYYVHAFKFLFLFFISSCCSCSIIFCISFSSLVLRSTNIAN